MERLSVNLTELGTLSEGNAGEIRRAAEEVIADGRDILRNVHALDGFAHIIPGHNTTTNICGEGT